MDKASLIINDGRQTLMQQMDVLINNLANTNTVGFREDFAIVKPVEFDGNGLNTRSSSEIASVHSRFANGPIYQTGNNLDVAIQGQGFISVQNAQGNEGYTRAGNFNIDENGFLKTAAGQWVIGNKGLVKIPPSEKINITDDGSIYAKLIGQTEFIKVNQIKLVNPELNNLIKSEDGLFQMADGQTVTESHSVKLISGSLEGSNVNPISLMSQMIEYSRNFEYQNTLSRKIQEDDTKSNSLLTQE